MKLYFKGHDYKYAAEQMLLTLFPGQRPEYPASPPAAGEDALELSLFRGRVWATATARLSYRGKRCAAVRRRPIHRRRLKAAPAYRRRRSAAAPRRRS